MDNKLDPAHKREKNDPSEGDRPWHLGVWVFVMLMTSWGGIYFALNSGDGKIKGGDNRTFEVIKKQTNIVKIYAFDQKRAKGLYMRHCSACHQASGLGVKGAFPPLSKSSWVVTDNIVPTKILLKGLEGEINVLGSTYDGVMPSFGRLPDHEIADLVNFIRSSWDNKAETDLTDKDVKELRDSLEKPSEAWSAKELR